MRSYPFLKGTVSRNYHFSYAHFQALHSKGKFLLLLCFQAGAQLCFITSSAGS